MPSRKKVAAVAKPKADADRVCEPWFQATAGGCTWSIVLVDPKTLLDANPSGPCDGLTLPDKGLIFIDSELPHDRMVVAVIHELLHAVLSFPGAGVAAEHIFGCSGAKVHRREEVVVSTIAPMLTGALISCGALSLPKLPRLPR